MNRTGVTPLSLCLLVAAFVAPGFAWAQAGPPVAWNGVTTHIETGDGLVPHDAGEPKSFTIGDQLGNRSGGNLFHRFEHFDLAETDTAVFTGDPAHAVVSYVASGTPSLIGGVLRSQIWRPSTGGADFYFLNPSGFMFGPSSAVDVPGAFHLSTALDGGFANGMQLTLAPEGAGDPLLTMAPLEEFGFIGAGGRIELQGSQWRIGPFGFSKEVDGEISFRGGEIAMSEGAALRSNGRDVTLVGSRDVLLYGSNANGGSRIVMFNGFVGSLGGSASILVQGDRVELSKGATVYTENSGAGCNGNRCGGSIAIEARSGIRLYGTDGNEGGTPPDSLLFGDRVVFPSTPGEGSADLLTLSNDSAKGVGSISLRAPVVEILDGADVVTLTGSSGGMGDIIIEAPERLELSGLGGDGLGSRVRSENQTDFDGDVGNISVDAGTVLLHEGGTLSSNTFGNTPGGDLTVTASRLVRISGRDNPADPGVAPQPSALQAAQTETNGEGAGGA
ncbi:MAG: filamentous hemagglutinin N-terminal domain-containing protein, partial [Planctomycetes bacterium]|nr:filamentous hemagglutinin N-terminal domain-containing protein [Planctomycetota bacterium]